MKTVFILLFPLFFILTSCHSDPAPGLDKVAVNNDEQNPSINPQDKTEKSSTFTAKPVSLTKQRAVEFNPNFSNFLEFKNNLNRYVIHAELANHPFDVLFSCETQSSPNNKKKFEKKIEANIENADLPIDLTDIVAQKEILYCSIKNENLTIIEASFHIKKDILVSVNSDILKMKMVAGKNEFGAVVLDEGVVLETLGGNLSLMIDQLISKEAEITSFGQEGNMKALNNQDGLSGGIININATEAFGHLMIKMRGQDGGVVTDVPTKIEEKPSIDASFNGDDGYTNSIQVCDERGDRVKCEYEDQLAQWPQSGKKGLKGYKGRRGYDGHFGGDSGIASVTIVDGSEFAIDSIDLIPGLGSLAGAPGEGGIGSVGGAPGTVSQHPEYCTLVSQGPNGDAGDRGDVGSNGKNGQRGRASYLDLKNDIKIEY